MPPAPPDRARIRAGIAAGVGVIAAAIVGRVGGLATVWVVVLAVVLAASAAFAFAFAPGEPAAVPVEAPAPIQATDDEDARWRSLRHDLRGILSPALLMADRLLMSTQDPLAKRAAETMIDGIERAEKRLSRDPAP